MQWFKGDLRITDQFDELDFDFIRKELCPENRWYSNYSQERLQACFKQSLTFSLFHGDKQIGFGRVITDYILVGYIADILISPEYRSRGLGKWLVQTITAHPKFVDLRRFILSTKSSNKLYKQANFKVLGEPEKHMELKHINFFEV